MRFTTVVLLLQNRDETQSTCCINFLISVLIETAKIIKLNRIVQNKMFFLITEKAKPQKTLFSWQEMF